MSALRMGTTVASRLKTVTGQNWDLRPTGCVRGLLDTDMQVLREGCFAFEGGSLKSELGH